MKGSLKNQPQYLLELELTQNERIILIYLLGRGANTAPESPAHQTIADNLIKILQEA